MKRTITALALAAPLATIALSLGGTPAMAEPAGPAIDQLTSVTPGPVNPHLPHGPEDKAPPKGDEDPEPGPGPDVPDDKAGPQQCPTHDDCTKDPGDEDGKDPGDKLGIPVPKRIDAGAGSSDEGLDLTWLIAGTALVTASGAAYAVRRRTRTLG